MAPKKGKGKGTGKKQVKDKSKKKTSYEYQKKRGNMIAGLSKLYKSLISTNTAGKAKINEIEGATVEVSSYGLVPSTKMILDSLARDFLQNISQKASRIVGSRALSKNKDTTARTIKENDILAAAQLVLSESHYKSALEYYIQKRREVMY